MAENPFLLPPGAVPAPRVEPAIVPDVASPPRDPDRYIAVPPSIESATHRIARPEPAPEPAAPEPAAPEESASEERQLGPVPPRFAATAWSLVLPDGSLVPVDEAIVLGRDPSPPPEHHDARAVPLSDPAKTVSKTHALLRRAPGEGGIRVTDLHSTNGTALTVAGVRTVLTPGGDGVAARGAVIELGSFTVVLDAR